MKQTLVIVIATILLCGCGVKPSEGRYYVPKDKCIMLPIEGKVGSSLNYSKVSLSFESDSIYLTTPFLLNRDSGFSIYFYEPEFKLTLGIEEYQTRLAFSFVDKVKDHYLYGMPYSELREFCPFWLWRNVSAIQIRYFPEDYAGTIPYYSLEDFSDALEATGSMPPFAYDIIIIRDFEQDFDSIFSLLRAHTDL